MYFTYESFCEAPVDAAVKNHDISLNSEFTPTRMLLNCDWFKFWNTTSHTGHGSGCTPLDDSVKNCDGEVMALLREGLVRAKKATRRSEIYGEFLAIDQAMDALQEGELCLILVDQVEEAMAHIAAKIARDQQPTP